MKRKGVITTLSGCVIIIVLLFIYRLYFSSPASFPENNQLLKDMNHLYPDASINTIQQTLYLDDYHVFVPFKTSNRKYGFSCWEWKNHKWGLIAINTSGDPYLWKLNKKDPSTYRFVWNIHPDDQLGSIQLYLLKDRGYHFTEGIHNYEPKIQMEKSISFQEQSFGEMKMPKDWLSVISSYNKVVSENQPNAFLTDWFAQGSIYFGWIPKDKMGKEARIDHTISGGGFSSYGDELEEIQFLSREEIEFSPR